MQTPRVDNESRNKRGKYTVQKEVKRTKGTDFSKMVTHLVFSECTGHLSTSQDYNSKQLMLTKMYIFLFYMYILHTKMLYILKVKRVPFLSKHIF